MESEAAGSIKIAINLMIVSTLIFMIVVLVNLVKPNIFYAVASVVNVAAEERERQFDDYDQKWVSGTKVLRVLKLYESTGFGIVYQTSKARSEGAYALNFGGIFQGAGVYSGEYRILNFPSWKIMNGMNDTFYTKSFLKNAATGDVIKDENTAPARHLSGAPEYILPDGRFFAALIKDVTGETIGICFTQE